MKIYEHILVHVGGKTFTFRNARFFRTTSSTRSASLTHYGNRELRIYEDNQLVAFFQCDFVMELESGS